eukprot:Em0015g504a
MEVESRKRVVSFLHMPPELLETIVLSPVLSIPDVFSLSGVCRLLYETVSRQWGKIAKNRWPNWDGAVVDGNAVDWRTLVWQRYMCERRLKALLDGLMDRGIHVPLLDDHDLKGFSEMVETGRCSSDLVDCVLRDFLMVPPKRANLTRQFYSLYGREHLHRMRLQGKWNALLELPESQQCLEAGAILLAQWMNPWNSISAESVVRELDDIAILVATRILAKQRAALDSTCPLVPTRPSSELMDQEEYYDDLNSYIHMVLKQKRGIPITMSIVYNSVARRLGVTLLPVNFPSHFLLKLRSPQERETGNVQDGVFIDAYNRGTRRTRLQCMELLPLLLPSLSPSYFTIMSFAQVCMRMVGNLCSNSTLMTGMELHRTYNEQTEQWGCLRLPQALSLQLFLCSKMMGLPFASDYAIACTGLCLNLKYSPVLVEQILQDLSQSESCATSTLELHHSALRAVKMKEELCSSLPKCRIPGLKFRVGMVATNVRYNYRCVIYGWDECCEMDESWMARMRVNQLQMGRRQPFYHVLVEDGTTRYAAQENLEPCTQADFPLIRHWELGRYFVGVMERGYVPNQALRNVYCEDCG